MAPTLPPPIYLPNKQIRNFSRQLVSDAPTKSLTGTLPFRTLPSTSFTPYQTKSKFFHGDSEDFDFRCKGIEGISMLNGELSRRGLDHHEYIYANVSKSSSIPGELLRCFPTPPRLSTKTPTSPSGSTMLSPAPISLPIVPTALSSSLIISAFQSPTYLPIHSPVYLPTSSSSSMPSIQSFSTATPLCNDEQGFRIMNIFLEQHHIEIRLGIFFYILPANYLMWHPVGHILLLKTVICTGVFNWRKYFGLLKHIFRTSAGGVHRFHLEDLGDKQFGLKEESGVHRYHADGRIQSIYHTWEVRALLAWEKSVLVSLYIIVYHLMKDLFALFICFVLSKLPA